MLPERQVVLHSWCAQADWDAPAVVGGAGARLFLADGRTVLDFSSLAECSNLGHQHPRLVAAIRAQAERLCFVTNSWGSEPRAELANRLLELSGFAGGRVFFTSGGADANEYAVKIARQASAKPRGWVVARDRSYHGASHLAGALSGDARTSDQMDAEAAPVSPLASVIRSGRPASPWRCQANHSPQRPVVLSAEVAARLEHQVPLTGLTYSGHPLACAAGLAALEAYEEERLIDRSRTLGARMFAELRNLAARHPVIGDVRGGHGLFAVVELVADRATREPISVWPEMAPPLNALLAAARAEGVSFAARGNLLILAPPLVIDERELGEALALLDALLARHFPETT